MGTEMAFFHHGAPMRQLLAACLFLFLSLEVAHAGILTTHAQLSAGYTDADDAQPSFLVMKGDNIESVGPISYSAAGSYEHGGISGSTYAEAFANLSGPGFLGVRAFARNDGFPSLFHAQSSNVHMAWRDVTAIGSGNSYSFITLHFQVTFELSNGGGNAGSYIVVNTDTDARDFNLGGDQASTQLFSDGSIQSVGWDNLIDHGDGTFTGSVIFNAPFDPTLGGYTWSIALHGVAGANGSSLQPVAFADASSLHTLGLSFVTDPDGNVLNNLTFDSGLQLQAASVPEPASVAIWGFGALGCAIAGYRRRQAAYTN